MICLLIGTKIGISEVLSTYVYFVQYIKSTTLYYYWFSVKKLPKNMPILTDKRCTMYISYQFGATFAIMQQPSLLLHMAKKFRHFVDFFVLLQIFGAFSLRGHSEWNRGFHRRRRFFVNGYQERRTRTESKWGSRPRLVFQKLTVPVRPFCFELTRPQEASLKNEQWRHLLVVTHFFGQKVQIVDKDV